MRWMATIAPRKVEVKGGYWTEKWDPYPTAASAHCYLVLRLTLMIVLHAPFSFHVALVLLTKAGIPFPKNS